MPPSNEPLIIVLLSTAWGPKHGGINSFNHDFAIGLAREGQSALRVFCAVLNPSDADIASAHATHKVTLIPIRRTVEPDRLDQAWAHEVALILKRDHNVRHVHWWVGHDLVSGEMAVAGREAVTGSKVALIKHTSYIDFTGTKHSDASRALAYDQEQCRLFSQADCRFAVGPKLQAALQEQLTGSKQVTMLVPGFPEHVVQNPAQHTFTAIVFGRMDRLNDRIKQGRLAVAGFASACKAGDGTRLAKNPRMYVFGIDQTGSPEDEGIRALATERVPGLNILPLPFTDDRDTLMGVLGRANLALMLSKHEGFGLTGWEAIATEIPLIIGRDSGLYELIRDLGGENPDRVIAIAVQGDNRGPDYESFTQEDEKLTADAVARVSRDLETFQAKAHGLKLALIDRYGCTWEATGRAFLDAIASGHSGPAHQVASQPAKQPEADASPEPPPTLIRIPGLSSLITHNVSLPPRHLLLPEAGVVPFHPAREPLLQDILSWAMAPTPPVGLRLDVGAGGAGKTRLMIEACHRLNALGGWHAGFLTAVANLELDYQALLRSGRNVFIVIDYAETRPEDVVALVRTAHNTAKRQLVRFALLARAAGDWWELIHRRASGNNELELVLQSPSTKRGPYRLETNDLADHERAEIFRSAAAAFAGRLDRPFSGVTPDLSAAHFSDVLYLHIAALAHVLGNQITDSRDLHRFVLDHERHYWQRSMGSSTASPDTLDNLGLAVAHLTLVGGTGSAEETRALLRQTPRVRHIPAADQERLLIQLRQLYPSGGGVGPLVPDVIGERQVAEALRHDDGLLEAVFAPESPDARVRQALTVLERLGSADPDEAHWLTKAATLAGSRKPREFVAVAEQGQGALSRRIVEAFPPGAAKPIARLLMAVRQRADKDSASLSRMMVLALEDDLGPAQAKHVARGPTRKRIKRLVALCEALESLHEYQAMRERIEEASALADLSLGTTLDDLRLRLKVKTQLFDIRRILGEHSAAFTAMEQASRIVELPGFRAEADAKAAIAGNLATALRNLGRFGEALAKAGEAERLRRAMYARQPDVYASNLATSLANLAAHLGDLGRYDESVAKAEEAESLRRALYARQPDAYAGDLATSLSNLANYLSDLGRHEEALAKAEEAERLQRALYAHQPDAHADYLAISHANLANHLGNLGRHEEALAQAEEAERMRRALYARQPDAYAGGLAMSFANLAKRLSDLGRHEEALVKAEEAERLQRALYARQPDAHAAYLATSLANLANHLRELGRHEEALAKAGEAERMRRALYARQPDAHAGGLATALANLATQLSELGRQEEEPAKAEEAERLQRALYARQPDAYSGDLANTLSIVGDCQVDTGRSGEGLARVDEGQEIWASLGRTLTPSENDCCFNGLRVRSSARLATGDIAGALADGAAAVRGLRSSVSKAGEVYRVMLLALVVLAEAAAAAAEPSAGQAVADAWQAARIELGSRPWLMRRPLARLAAILEDKPSLINQVPGLDRLKDDLAVAEAAWRATMDRG
jgi:glycosyltransferase involved in cell wall biosynthesis